MQAHPARCKLSRASVALPDPLDNPELRDRRDSPDSPADPEHLVKTADKAHPDHLDLKGHPDILAKQEDPEHLDSPEPPVFHRKFDCSSHRFRLAQNS